MGHLGLIMLVFVKYAVAIFMTMSPHYLLHAATVLIDDNSSPYEFHVKYTTIMRLCQTKQIVTVNDQFPGPTLLVQEDQFVQVKVTNYLPDKNITIHWHGVRQMRSGWYDGPAYITQCPIQPGQSYLYNFRVSGQRGTLFWHAHISWLRSTVYGAFIILPNTQPLYPFPEPFKEVPIVLGEWWVTDTEVLIQEAMKSGVAPNASDAYTINGQPGLQYNCSSQDVFKLPTLQKGQTYLLRIINAGLNDDLFLCVANHELTVVEIDASYTKPFKAKTLHVAPGQTMGVLLKADQPAHRYIMAVGAYNSAEPDPAFDDSMATAVLEYAGSSKTSSPIYPALPASNDNNLPLTFASSLRSLNSKAFPALVPTTVDHDLFFTVSLALKACPRSRKCLGPQGGQLSGSINNISFTAPTTSMLQYFFADRSTFTNNKQASSKAGKSLIFTDFPQKPGMPYDYTGSQLLNLSPQMGTRVLVLPFNANVQLVLQGTGILRNQSHPMHLHGFSFYVVGQGLGNYDSSIHPSSFNLIDPPERNTVSVPKGGWAAIRFRADNPGVWFLHCHYEVHVSWGMETAFLVKNGNGAQQCLQAPPDDLPSC